MIYELDYTVGRGRVLTVSYSNGEKWKLVGKCSRCGACCEKAKQIVPEFADKKGRCSKFSYEIENGKKVGVCSLYESRPVWCFMYPRDPREPLHKECSFSWERID